MKKAGKIVIPMNPGPRQAYRLGAIMNIETNSKSMNVQNKATPTLTSNLAYLSIWDDDSTVVAYNVACKHSETSDDATSSTQPNIDHDSALTAILLLTHICVKIIVEYSSLVVGFLVQTSVHHSSKLNTVRDKFYD